MSQDVLAALITAVGVTLAAVAGSALNISGRLRDPRHELERDLKILGMLPADSNAREALLTSIDVRVSSLVTQEGDTRRNWPGFWLALVFLLVFGILAWRLATWGGWWWFGAVPAGLVSAAMLIVIPDEFKKAARNERGQLIE